MLAIMVSLLSTYFYLNAYKIDLTSVDYQNYIHGDKAPVIELILEDEILLRQRLRSSDVFDASGEHQLSFVQVDSAQYQEIKENSRQIKLHINGENIPYVMGEQGKALKIIWSNRKLALVKKGDLRTIAANVWRDNVSKKNIVECFGKELCQSIQVSGKGWGVLEGPYLRSEENKLRRGMPRGRWLFGPVSKIAINSKIETEVIMAINILALNPGLELSLKGPILAAKTSPADPYTTPYGGLQLYPQAKLIKVALKPGANNIFLGFSKWHQPSAGERRPLAAYLTTLKIKAAQVPQNGSNGG